MAETQQVVTIMTRFLTQGRESQRKTVETINEMNGALYTTRETFQRVGNGWRKLNKQTIEGRKVAQKFKAEWLSVMFAGMAIERVFGGILSTQTELWGLNEYFAATITTVMIPAMEVLFNVLAPILDTFMNLPEPVQKFIGFMVIGGAVVGTIAAALGSAALALSGLAVIFPTLTPLVNGFIAAISNVKNLALGGIAVTLLMKGMVDATKGDWVMATADILGAGGLAVITKSPKLGAGVLGISAVIAMTQIVDAGGKINPTTLVQTLVSAGIAGATVGGPLGATIAIGVVLVWTAGSKVGGMLAELDRMKGSKVISGILSNPTAAKQLGFLFGEDAVKNKQSELGINRFASGGIVPGNLGQAVPIIAHGGERIVPSGQTSGMGGGEMIINNTYNISVADRREFEAMLRDNNNKLTEDIRRLAQT